MSDEFVAINPATEQEVGRHPAHDDTEVEHRLARSWSAFGEWRRVSLDERGTVLRDLAAGLERRREDLATLMTAEMGKPITAARAEVDKCAWVCRHYADHAADYLASEDVATEARTSYVRYDPLGPVLAVMPWNFPLWQVFRAAAPALAAGNTMLLKHASNVPGCALAIEDLFAEAAAPEGAFTTLMIGSGRVAEVIADQRVRGVTLTGSEHAGRVVASQAGDRLVPTVLELGGSDAFVVLDDADVGRAAEVGATSRLINNGESCIAAKRFIVVDAVADVFVEALAGHIAAARVGDPADDDTEVGPLARADLRDDLDDQVRRTVAAGATVVTGGDPIDGPGFFYAPTVLDGVSPQMAAGAEETFGPVAAVLRVPDQAAAIATANASAYGLGASVWTEDRKRGERVAADLEAGCVFVNQLVKSDPRVPFGGVKDSGYGRELGRAGARAFTNVKTVWVE
jgi:succinate-semialdehyde dehydrogenase / glutarate-semialdehyde dehydrogenase